MHTPSNAAPSRTDLHAGRLAPCPASPNCVCSQDSDPPHAIAPLVFRGPAATAMLALKETLAAQPRVRVISETPGYIRAEFRTAVFRFVDDVEFLLAEDGQVIHVRSASRMGYSDLGANRRRIEAIRRAFATRNP